MPAAGISLTDAAVEKIRTLVPDGEGTGKGLRVKVVGGGCSGLSYKMDLDEKRDGDRVFEREGARIIVDRKSYLYLNGTELDYSDDLMHAGFNLRNPNVKRTCGCGASFGV
ncbi:MAG TPA: iron-sulfur cluster assembly accessory protein [Candidatus Binatia bacterium]|nr:iron-sulfur cluster assembly accessory protein [Candidatus Binatia bacterium]